MNAVRDSDSYNQPIQQMIELHSFINKINLFLNSFLFNHFYEWLKEMDEESYYNSTWLYQSLLQWPWMKCC